MRSHSVVLVFEVGAIRVMCQHIEPKGNRWYYRRRIPQDCRELHKDPGAKKAPEQVYFSLKTANKAEACKLAVSHTRRFDALWKAHREGNVDPKVSLAQLQAAGLAPGDGAKYPELDPVTDFVGDLLGRVDLWEDRPDPTRQERMTYDMLMTGNVPKTLSDARDKHIELGKLSKEPKQVQQFERAWAILLEVTGDITLNNLTRDHANQFVRKVITKGKGPKGNGPATVERYLKQVSPVITTAIREFELRMNNPFVGVVIPNKAEGQRKPRESFTQDEIKTIQKRCRDKNDQRRWAIAMISDTGARLAEIIGLRKSDVVLDASIPHIVIKRHDLRRVKTDASERKVPLVGQALWAAEQGMKTKGDLLFPDFAPKKPDTPVDAGSASAALNKWLKDNDLVGDGQTIHSFRHAMRDRLRDVEAPIDVADAIGGWARQSVGDGYGRGHGLDVLQKHMLRVVL
jgi:integrase